MLFYQVELIKHGHDTCLEFMEFAASGDYAETQAHFHSTMEITVIVDGEGFFKSSGAEHPFGKGDCFIFNSMEPHNIFSENASASLKYLSLNFVPSFISSLEMEDFNLRYLEPFYFTNRSCRIPYPEPCAKEVGTLFGKIQTALYEKKDGYPLAVKAYLFLMLSEIACHYQKDVPSLNPSRRDVPVLQDSFTKVLDYIEENLTQDITIDQLSQVAAMNRYYFSTFFKKQMSESPVQYITRKRIRLAIELLKDENLSILEVALRSGFNNAANFNRAFRQLTETSPSEYRKKQKKECL